MHKPILKAVSEIISVIQDGGRIAKEQQNEIVELFSSCLKERKLTQFESSSIRICLWFINDRRTFYCLPEFKKQIVKRGFEALSLEEQKQYEDIVGNFALTNATGLMTLSHNNNEAEEIINYLLTYFDNLPNCKIETICLISAITLKGMLRDLSGDSGRALYYYNIVLSCLGEKNIPIEMKHRIDVLLKEKKSGEQKIFA